MSYETRMIDILFWIVVLGLVFDYTNGFHDSANVVSTVIATKALRPLTAILMAGVLNVVGATQIGGVAATISEGLVNAGGASQLLVLAAVVGAIVWNIATWYFGIPSSSSYALVGGLLGSAFIQGGPEMILWKGVLNKVIIPMVLSPFIGFFIAFIFMKILRFLIRRKNYEKQFRYCQIFSAGCVALAHGMNDAQKSMGIITLGLFSAGVITNMHIPFWVILSCALVMGVGTCTGGFRIIHTMGYKITNLIPVQGFVAEMSSSVVILMASFFGMPISSTHMIVGSITGVGFAKGNERVSWTTAQKLILAWVLTLPGSALISILFYKLIY